VGTWENVLQEKGETSIEIRRQAPVRGLPKKDVQGSV